MQKTHIFLYYSRRYTACHKCFFTEINLTYKGNTPLFVVNYQLNIEKGELLKLFRLLFTMFVGN